MPAPPARSSSDLEAFDFIARLYAAAIQPESWPEFLRASDRWLSTAKYSGASERWLHSHVMRAAAISADLMAALTQSRLMAGTLDALPYGVFLLDRTERVLIMNRFARTLLDEADALAIGEDGHLRWKNVAHSPRVVGSDRSRAKQRPIGVTLPAQIERLSGKGSLTILGVPLRPRSDTFIRQAPVTIVFVCDHVRTNPALQRMLRSLYELTPAEARLADCLQRGMSLKEVATELKVRSSTTRTHLKRLLLKTGTHSQAQLVAILSLSAACCHDFRAQPPRPDPVTGRQNREDVRSKARI